MCFLRLCTILALAAGPAAALPNVTFTCSVPGSYANVHLRELVQRNCDKVNITARDFEAAAEDSSAFWIRANLDGNASEQAASAQKSAWLAQARDASELCEAAAAQLALGARAHTEEAARKHMEEAARLAVNAWGSVITGGQECCTLLTSPYCRSTGVSKWTLLLAAPFAVLLLLFAGSLASLCWARVRVSRCCSRRGRGQGKGKGKSQDLEAVAVDGVAPASAAGPAAAAKEAAPTLLAAGAAAGTEGVLSGMMAYALKGLGAALDPRAGGSLESELRDLMLHHSCLRVLPGAQQFAESTAGLFAALQRTFDFQVDSTKNQYEHFLSLWRSQVAMVADRFYEAGEPVDETRLLEEAVGDIHAELLEGFIGWRALLDGHEPSDLGDRTKARPMGGACWEPPLPSGEVAADSAGLEVELAEIAMYLLVWGEAGNVRFMPEVVYFITELALSSEGVVMRPRAADEHEGDEAGSPFQSNMFLSRIIRPIYNVVFEEWYDCVEGKGAQRDKKKLKPSFENFLPPDVANYDDWNEMFCDPQRLVEGLVLSDGVDRLFSRPRARRFAALAEVDWRTSLQAKDTKTHNEVHSLWGVFASTHRVWLLHTVLFALGVIAVTGDAPAVPGGATPLGGQGAGERFAVAGLIVPAHALLWSVARWQVMGRAVKSRCGLLWVCEVLMNSVCLVAPLGTFAAVRFAKEFGYQDKLDLLLPIHFGVSAFGLFFLLFVPKTGERYQIWSPTSVPLRKRYVRYVFWIVVIGMKFLLGTYIFRAVYEATLELDIAKVGQQTPLELAQVWRNPTWGANVLLWIFVWFTTYCLFLSDTQLWFTIACAFLGVVTMLVQRGCGLYRFMLEDAIAHIPERFSEKVIGYYGRDQEKGGALRSKLSPYFPDIWDRALEYMRYEDKIDNQLMGDLSFSASEAGHHIVWKDLTKPLRHRSLEAPGSAPGAASPRKVRLPDLFRKKNPMETALRQTCMSDPSWPQNPDAQWRLIALARGLGLPMPRPFRAPYMPGLTVLIPHYGESILMEKDELFKEGQQEVPLMHWLKNTYDAEFAAFTSRMQGQAGHDWPVAGSEWSEYTGNQWKKIGSWSSMRMQTLWRTVAGMCLYHPALQCHYEAQADRSSSLAKPEVWDPSDCFTCLVSMQMYKFFNKTQLEHTNLMFDKFPSCLKVAFIDCEDKNESAQADGVHSQQERRYFSCLIDGTCPTTEEQRRKPKLRIELPGYPILGDGKGDNQNHAIPFMRGPFAQCIDANQGGYFEQALLLPCALGEFRSRARGDAEAKKIVGFPEHITSDIGSIGDFAASAEVAFGTILQRSYAALGARMHYGHPDIMNKVYMMQQGGVSKATKTLNLSEDIFAGMDFTLRGQGRSIKHCEYFHLAKGRDLGFNTVLGFFSKLSSGTGEQVLTRQAFRLGQSLHLPEALTFYYAHVGYYFTQFLVSMSLPLLVFVWLLVLFSDCEGKFDAFLGCDELSGHRASSAEIMARLLGVWFSWLLLLFLVATSLPLFVEVWMERSFLTALARFFKQMCTMSPLLFIFQGKIIGHYIVNEIRYGGATYVSTGRGLPCDRRPFIGEVEEKGLRLRKVGGLYLDYASIAYYDGAMLLCGTVMIAVIGGVSRAGEAQTQLNWVFVSLALTVVSWLFAPFIFNPYQFQATPFLKDLRSLAAFFLQDGGDLWVDWYDRTQLRRSSGRSVIDIGFFVAALLLVAWYAMMNVKLEALGRIYSVYVEGQVFDFNMLMLTPPIVASLLYCVLASLADWLMDRYSDVRRSRLRPRRLKARSSLDLEGGLATDDDEERLEAHATDRDRDVRSTRLPGEGETGQEVRGCCSSGVPLALSAVAVLVLDVAEAAFALHRLYYVGWQRAFVGGLVLKWGILCLQVHLGEGLLRSCCECCPLAPIALWVRAHRMARDIFTSSLIMFALAPLVCVNKLNDLLCPGLSLHHLLIYRNPNHLRKKEIAGCQFYSPGTDHAAAPPAAAGAGAGASAAPEQL